MARFCLTVLKGLLSFLNFKSHYVSYKHIYKQLELEEYSKVRQIIEFGERIVTVSDEYDDEYKHKVNSIND